MPDRLNFLNFISKALNQCDTRDSLTEILQYTARLWAGTCLHDDLAARRVYKSLSEGRKIFRLFRFIPELESLLKLNEVDPIIYKVAFTQSVAVAVFFLLDNWIYFLETVKSKTRGDIRLLKLMKNRVSLFRIILALMLTLLELRELVRRNETKSDVRHNTYFDLSVRFWHESLRLWLTLHKLHILELFLSSKHEDVQIMRDRNRYDVVPGAVGLVAAITGFLRRAVLRRSSLSV